MYKKKLENKTLPQWNLDDLVSPDEAKKSEEILSNLEQEAKDFQQAYKSKLLSLTIPNFEKAIHAYQNIEEELDRITSFTFLQFSTHTLNETFKQNLQNTQEKTNDIRAYLLFFEVEINLMPQNIMMKHIESKNVFSPWLKNIYSLKKYQLNEDLEQIFLDKSAVCYTSWIKLYNDTLSHIEVSIDDQKYDLKEALHQLRSPHEITRKNASIALGEALKKNIDTYTIIYNSLIKDKLIEDKWRKRPHVDTARNASNFVEDDVVQALVNTTKKSYAQLSHRFYKYKAKHLKKDKLELWDINAPWITDEAYMPWEDAKEVVLEAYRKFSPEMGKIGKLFFDNQWIDAAPTKGKMSGAFAHPTVPSVHPYLLVNYQGKIQDVMTLAHELGHGIHQYLAAPQGHFMSDTTINLAETASVFGEMLTFQSLIENEKNTTKRTQFLANKIQDMLSTVTRQVSFYCFEKEVHELRKLGELSKKQICDVWLKTQKECLGSHINYTEYYQYYWCYISHFFEVPFYVYGYAFGECLVNSLYAQYKKNYKGFETLYIDLLKAGGTKRHDELLQPFSLQTKDPLFWLQGLQLIEEYIDELEDISCA